jgi:hypothetical protein
MIRWAEKSASLIRNIMGRPKGSKNKGKEVVTTTETPKRKRRTKAEMAADLAKETVVEAQAEEVEESVAEEKPKKGRKKKEVPEDVKTLTATIPLPEDKGFSVSFWNFDTFSKLEENTKALAITIKKKGLEIGVSADENKQTIKLSLADMKMVKDRPLYSDWLELSFEEFCNLIDFLREAPELKKKYEKLQKQLEKKKEE